MQRIILETCGHWGIWSEWWGDMILWLLSTLSTFCILIILRQILTIWRTVWETWHLRHRLQFWRLRTWIQSIIVTWQLIVTLDSIRNSCDVLRVEMSKRRGGDEEFRRSWQSFQGCDWELRLNVIKSCDWIVMNIWSKVLLKSYHQLCDEVFWKQQNLFILIWF